MSLVPPGEPLPLLRCFADGTTPLKLGDKIYYYLSTKTLILDGDTYLYIIAVSSNADGTDHAYLNNKYYMKVKPQYYKLD